MSRRLARWLVDRLDGSVDRFATWVGTLSLSGRRIVFTVVTFFFVTSVAVAGASLARHTPERRGGDTESASSTPAATTPPTAIPGESVAPLSDGDERGGPSPVSDDDLAAAEAVAEAFVTEYATIRWDESPAAVIERIRPHVTESFAEQALADLELDADHTESQQVVSVAEVKHIHVQALAQSRITLVVVARQHTRTVDGETESHPSFTVELHQANDGWRVDQLVF